MTIVVDASLVTVLASGDPRKSAVQTLMRRWIESAEGLHAPALLRYEVANGLTRLVAAGLFPPDRLRAAWETLDALPLAYHPLEVDGDRVINIALQLRRSSAYDAAYIALAEQLGAELWTLDGPLARNAIGVGFPVHLVQ